MTIVGVVGDAVYSSLRVPAHRRRGTRRCRNSTCPSSPQTLVPAPIGRAITDEFAGRVERCRGGDRQGQSEHSRSRFRPLSDYVDAARNQERLVALLAGAFGTLGLLLAGLGLYGITAYAVAVRRSEIGIRMALGAVASRIVRLMLARVAMLVASGAVAGIAVSLWLSRFVASLLYGSNRTTLRRCSAAFIVLASVGLVAGAIPASKAARTNPATVLREG